MMNLIKTLIVFLVLYLLDSKALSKPLEPSSNNPHHFAFHTGHITSFIDGSNHKKPKTIVEWESESESDGRRKTKTDGYVLTRDENGKIYKRKLTEEDHAKVLQHKAKMKEAMELFQKKMSEWMKRGFPLHVHHVHGSLVNPNKPPTTGQEANESSPNAPSHESLPRSQPGPPHPIHGHHVFSAFMPFFSVINPFMF